MALPSVTILKFFTTGWSSMANVVIVDPKTSPREKDENGVRQTRGKTG
jgi:hypothetical protein